MRHRSLAWMVGRRRVRATRSKRVLNSFHRAWRGAGGGEGGGAGYGGETPGRPTAVADWTLCNSLMHTKQLSTR